MVRLSCIALASLVFVFGCSAPSGMDGGPGEDAGPVDAGPSADEACTALATARCAKRNECEPATLTATYGDLSTCIGRDKLSCLASVSAPDTGNTPTSLQTCAGAYAAWDCADWANAMAPAACAQRAGSRSTGEACTFPSQCSSGFCATRRGAKCGACAATPTVGTPCGDGVGCGGNGLSCDNATLTCQPVVTDGGSCLSGTCGYGFGCVADGGVCLPQGNLVDAGCDSSERTEPACRRELGLSCVRRRCVPTTFASAGSTCGLDLAANTFTRCRAGGNCVGDGGVGGSQCLAPANDGVACASPGGALCLSPARCVSLDGASVDAGEPLSGACQLPSGVLCQ